MPRKSAPINMSAQSVKILQELCSIPTAPFVESRVVEYVRQFVKSHRRLQLTEDRFGNLLIELPASRRNSIDRWVFTAHMDHPGFVARRMTDNKTLEADFFGGVHKDYFPGSKVRFFEGDRQVRATVIKCQLAKDGWPNKATLRVAGPVTAGTPGMWDVGEGRTKGKRFYSRVCDDLAGAAAALAMLDTLVKNPPKISVAVLLTRAEEEGFIGAIAASIKPKLLRKTDRVIAIECSAAQPYAPQGKGAIIRVGDRTSIFHSGISYFITQVATDLAKKDKTFQFQRALMPGGTCEATVYNVYSFTAGSICVPLGNYHNMDKEKKKIGPEYIDLGDWKSMVKLFVATARRGAEYEPGHKELKRKVRERFEKMKSLL